MDSLVSQLRSLIGTPPAGLEFLEYLFLGFLLIFLVYSAVSVHFGGLSLVGQVISDVRSTGRFG